MFSCPVDLFQRTPDIGNCLQRLDGLTGLVLIGFCQKPAIGILPAWQLVATDPQISPVYPRDSAFSTRLQVRSDHFDYQPSSANSSPFHLPPASSVPAIAGWKYQLDHLWQQTLDVHSSEQHGRQTAGQPLEFRGGLMGFCGYDLAASQLNRSQRFARHTAAAFGFYDVFLQQEPEGEWRLHALSAGMLEKALAVLQNHIHAADRQPFVPAQLSQPLAPVWQMDQYRHAFDQVQQYIRAGDCYQINLTQPWTGQLAQGSLAGMATPLWQTTRQPPYRGYLSLPGFELLSCSPESFLRFDAEGQVTARPIKGTVARSADPEEDQQRQVWLVSSEKDRAENLMIVDMLRNDLGREAVTGSVTVDRLFELHSFSHVHHLESTVSATLAPSVSPLSALFSALPGGSVTGTPKKRATEIIDQLEILPRGAYCGSLGFLNLDGTGEFNILIRTLQKQGNQLSLWAGGGITSHSQVDVEYQESVDKIAAIRDCINQLPVSVNGG